MNLPNYRVYIIYIYIPGIPSNPLIDHDVHHQHYRSGVSPIFAHTNTQISHNKLITYIYMYYYFSLLLLIINYVFSFLFIFIFIILYIHIDVPMLFHYRLSLDHSIFFNVSILRFINTYYSNNVDTVVIHQFLTHTSTAYSI